MEGLLEYRFIPLYSKGIFFSFRNFDKQRFCRSYSVFRFLLLYGAVKTAGTVWENMLFAVGAAFLMFSAMGIVNVANGETRVLTVIGSIKILK